MPHVIIKATVYWLLLICPILFQVIYIYLISPTPSNSPFPYTLFPVTTSHVCGEPPLPTSIPCGFCGLGRTSHHAHSRDSVGSRLGIWSRASVSPVVSDWLRGRHIAQGRQVRANQSPLEGVHGLQVLPSDPDLNLETRWLKLGLPSCQLA